MLKFLRKYDKWILAVGGSLLMVAFLLPQALQQIGQGGADRAVATYAYGEITGRDRVEANTQLRFLGNAAGEMLNRLGVEDDEHWVMLAEEARRGGFVGGPETGRLYFDGLARAQGVDPEMAYAALVVATGVGDETASNALATLGGIDRMRLAHLQAQRRSEPEMVRQFLSTTVAVGLHAGLISADTLLGTVSEFPAPDELEAFFVEHRDTARGAGRLDFGYRVEDAVKVEWIDLAPRAFEGAVVLDPVEVNARWRRSRELYAGEFVEERERVEEDMRREEGARLLADAQTFVKSSVSRAERAGTVVDLLEVSVGVAEALRERSGVEIEAVPFDRRDERWLTLSELRGTARVRDARLQAAGAALFPEVALSVRELDSSDRFGYGVGDVVGPFRSSAGSLIYAKVIDVRPAGAPESLEAVREQVVADFRLEKAYEELVSRSSRYPVQIAARSIATVLADAGGDLLAGVRATPRRIAPPVTREVNGNVLGKLNRPEVAGAVYETAGAFEAIGDVRELPAESRVVTVELPDEASVAVCEIISVDAVTESSYRLRAMESLQALERERVFQAFSGGPFTLARMKERLGYQRVGGSEEDEEVAGDDGGAVADGSSGS